MKNLKNLKNKVGVISASVSALAFSAVPAFAEPTTFTVPELPMTSYYALMTGVLAALAGMWIGRKLVKTTNKS